MTDNQKRNFLEKLANCANVSMAARFAGVTRKAAYYAKEKATADDSDNFNELWEDAVETGLDQLEEDLVSCARGEMKGNIGGFIYLLKARRYEKRTDPDAPKTLKIIWDDGD